MRTRRSQFSGNQVPSGSEDQPRERRHLSVLLHEVLSGLDIQTDDVVVDATLGGAGHARHMADLLGPGGVIVGFDADHDAIERAQEALADTAPKTILIEDNFRTIDAQLKSHGIERIDKALFDLGWSSFQLEVGRGFSLKSTDPLLMTYAKRSADHTLTAATIVNEWAEESIADVLYGWGEERYSRRIAKAIVEARAKKAFSTADELVEVILRAVPTAYRYGKIHPATRTFQALRIAVNDEMGSLAAGLSGAWKMLAPGGRIAVITFHSIEDRIVKQTFRQWEDDGEGERLTRKPIVPTAEEIASNPRARSAKLRIIKKS